MINFNLDISKRKILIIGSGNIAKRRLKKILECAKDIRIDIVSPDFNNEIKSIFSKNRILNFLKGNLDSPI